MRHVTPVLLVWVVLGCGAAESAPAAGIECVWNDGTGTWTNTQVMNRLDEKPPVFAADHKATDLAFGTRICRLTGPTGSNALIENDLQTRNKNPWMHFANPWSRSGDHFILESYGLLPGKTYGAYVTRIMTLDRENFTVRLHRAVPEPPNGAALVSENKGLWFSPDHELVLFGCTAYEAQLWACNVGDEPVTLGTRTVPANGFLLMADFSSLDKDTPLALSQGFMWQDGKTFSWGIKEKGTGRALGVVIYFWTDDPQVGKQVLIPVKGFKVYDENWTDRKHYVWLAGSNDGVPEHFPNAKDYGIVRYDREGKYADHASKGGAGSFFAATGKACGFDGWWVNRNYWEVNRTFLRNAADVKTYWQIWPPTMAGKPGLQDDPLKLGTAFTCNPSFHLSDWVYWADYSIHSKSGTDYTKVPTPVLGQDEIIAADVSTPGEVRRFRRICRLWNDDVDRSYKYQPDCTPSPGNDYVLYWTNLAAAGEDYRRTDSFLARIAK